MVEKSFDRWEQQLAETARAFSYPPTPVLARNVTRQMHEQGLRGVKRPVVPRLAWVAIAILILLTSLLAVPSVRAQILEFLQVGIVRIFLVEPPPTVIAPAGTSTAANPEGTTLLTSTPNLTQAPSPIPLNLYGETSLEEASSQLPFPIQLPHYPVNLGEPDQVYLQDLEGQILVLVWLDRDQPSQVRMSLHMYTGRNLSGGKFQPPIVQDTRVNGKPAVWAEGPYILKLRNGFFEEVRLIEGHVLIWESDGITYRLETDLSIEEAVKVAESLHPYSPPIP